MVVSQTFTLTHVWHARIQYKLGSAQQFLVKRWVYTQQLASAALLGVWKVPTEQSNISHMSAVYFVCNTQVSDYRKRRIKLESSAGIGMALTFDTSTAERSVSWVRNCSSFSCHDVSFERFHRSRRYRCYVLMSQLLARGNEVRNNVGHYQVAYCVSVSHSVPTNRPLPPFALQPLMKTGRNSAGVGALED